MCYVRVLVNPCVFPKMSWVGEEALIPVFGGGANVLPTIHINDLARWVKILLLSLKLLFSLRKY